MPLCGNCGTGNPDEARFCFACGTALGVEASAPRELRKRVTIVFSDLIGSTRLGEGLDSESLRQVMSSYFATMESVLERHGGTVEKFIGDAVMAVFGIPAVREDDALRAVRAASEMRGELEELNERLEARWGVRLRVRMGVNTGEVVAGDPSRGQAFATGDAVNVAARLEQAAGADEILIGDETRRLVRDAVRAEAVEPLTLKGKSRPVPAFRLVEVLAEASGVVRRLDSPIVGRERELARLRDAFERAASERACQLVSVLAAAGAGKSRLARELTAALDGRATVLRGRCLPYGEGITFWPVTEIVKQAAAIGSGDSPDQARVKLAALVPDGEEGAVVVERVAGIVGLADMAASPEGTFWAVRKLLEALSSKRPLVVVFDDIHWAEGTFLDLVEYLAGNGDELPVLLLALARPDVLDRRPSLADGDRALVLEPLDSDESRLLIDNLLDNASVDQDLREHIATAADGNPLFVEELLRMLIDEGVLERDGGRWVRTRELESVSVPPTIHALLAARLDRLTAAQRTVLQRASVMGRGFWRGAVHALSPGDDPVQLDGLLDVLARKELVEPGGLRFAGEDGLCFGHILIRDVAYQGILKETRADLHERFADWLEGQAGERATEYEEILGYHLEQAHGYRVELAPVDERARDLGSRASHRLGHSGRRALARGDMPAAVKLLERALVLVADDEPARADLSLKLGIALAETGDLARADSLLADRLDFERRGRPFLSYRDDTGKQRLFDLESVGSRVTIGRRAGNEVALSWDDEVSRYHAALERTGEVWTLVEEGLSRNGSFLNGRRVTGRQQLSDGDVLRFGDTIVLYRVPARAMRRQGPPPASGVTAMAPIPNGALELSETERRVLAVLSTQLADGTATTSPVNSRRIAEELALTTGEVQSTVARLSRLFETDHLPDDQQQGRLVERASTSGLFQRPEDTDRPAT